MRVPVPFDPFRPRRAPLAGAGLLAISLSACSVAPLQAPRAEEEIGLVAGLVAPLKVSVEPRPLDESSQVDGTLTLAEAAERALHTHPALQAALASVQVALTDAEQARLLANPVLNVQVGWFAGAPWVNALADADLVAALLRPRRASIADFRLRAATSAAVRTALDLLLELQSSYVAVQASEALVPLLQERRELAERVLSLTRRRVEAGEVAESDQIALDAALIEVQLELDLARRELRQRRLKLARLVGEPNSAATWTLEPLSPAPDLADDEEQQALRSALEHRPEVLETRWELAALGEEREIVRWTVLEGGALGPMMQQQEGQRAFGPSVALPLPLFDTGETRQRRAEWLRVEARHRLVEIQRRIVEEVRVACEALRATRECERKLGGELVPRLLLRRALAESAYSAGNTDLTPLLLAESDLREAQVKELLCRQEALTALLELRRAAGGLERRAPSPDS